MDKNIRMLALRDVVGDILSEYKNSAQRCPPRVWFERCIERILRVVEEGWSPRPLDPGVCELADFSPFIFIHCSDGRIKLQFAANLIAANLNDLVGHSPFVYVNYCGGCGAKSSVPVEEIVTP